jgi:GT2 family glycosyltransferase
VDDASEALTKRFVRSFCADVSKAVLICADENVGFTQAISLGLKKSDSPFFVALNSDTIVLDGWLEKLLATLDSAPNVAIVGPVSNSAAWQNICEPVDEDGNFIRNPMPDYEGCCDFQETASRAANLGAPYSPLIHGFCALLHRDAYEHVGQLDAVSFPRGYGEFQDLCLRFWDAGYRAKISNDCFVGHVGGASLGPSRRSDLSKLARRTLYEKHTALRYLTFEAASIFSIPMANWRAQFELLRPPVHSEP